MAWVYRFYLSRNYPRILRYRPVPVALEYHYNRDRTPPRWEFVARRMQPGPPVTCLLAASIYSRDDLDTALFHDGFTADKGTPARAIMERLVREGHAMERLGRG